MDTLWLDSAANLWKEIEEMEAKAAYFGMAEEVSEVNGDASYYKTGINPITIRTLHTQNTDTPATDKNLSKDSTSYAVCCCRLA